MIGGAGLLIVVVLALLFGVDPQALLQPQPGQPQGGADVDPNLDAQRELKEFVAVVLADTEDVWHEQFRRMGQAYEEPKLVLFSGQVNSACGFASAAMGPFYCPADHKVYLDLRFFDELRTRFQAPGEFAQAYVVAHEIGHHVQNQLGITQKVHGARGRVSEREFNDLSVRLELQADFLAGVWAHHAQRTRRILEEGDIEAALRAAAAIGDDRLQRQSQGYVVPDSFTHGTSEQRARWFRRGLQTGDMSAGDTFNAEEL
jgi:predicted metalloprotease